MSITSLITQYVISGITSGSIYALAHLLKVRAIAEARIKTDKINADILCNLLRSKFLPEAYVPNKETIEAKNVSPGIGFVVRGAG